MRRVLFLVLPLCAALLVQGAWYWPFGSKEDDPSEPLRLHRLLEDANNYIEIAEDEALSGNADKALENYRLALGELDRVERENPDRAETAEFSPLRNKRAACVAAMDAIRFAQVDNNERAVSVTDTRELQKRWNKKHGIKDPPEAKQKQDPKDTADTKDLDTADTKDLKVAKDASAVKAPAAAPESTPVPEPSHSPVPEPEPSSEPVPPKPVVAQPAQPAPKPAVATPATAKSVEPELSVENDFAARRKMAIAEVRNKDFVAADILLEDLLKEKPNDLNLLMLRAAAQAGMGSQYAARRTLERAMRTHPRSHLPYYNLANLCLQIGDGVEVARQYYELGRTVGGPPMPALEARLQLAK